MAEVFSPSSIESMMYPKLYSDSKDSKALFFSIIPLAATAALKCPHLPQARYVVCSCRILRTQTPLVRLQPPELHEEEAVEELFWVLVLGVGSGVTGLGFMVLGPDCSSACTAGPSSGNLASAKSWKSSDTVVASSSVGG